MVKQSGFIKNAEFRIKNKKWLRYSSQIARRVLSAMEDIEGMDKEMLAKKSKLKIESISKILSGNANITLKTISKLSAALNVDLITFPHYKYMEKERAAQE